jgi:hypothetical protein
MIARAPHRSILALLLFALVGVLVGGCGRASPTRPLSSHRAHLAAPRADSFLSLWPACACGKATVLAQFSLRDGRRLATLAEVPTPAGEDVSFLSPLPSGSLALTYSSGPACSAPATAYCGAEPGSCTSKVDALDPYTGVSNVLLRLPSSTLTLDAVPSPDGRMVAMRAAGCATSWFNQHVVVRDLRSGRQWSIGADTARCHELTSPAWNPSGTKLVFAYGPSRLPAGTKPSNSQVCEMPRANRLVVVSALRSSSSRSWKLIPADRGCSYQAAAFDSEGIAAAEGCGPNPNLGRAYLLQLNRGEHVVRRIPLEPGWEDGLIASERDGDVLVTEDQPANEGYRPYDWVWQFNGHRLRAIAHYRALDADQVVAVPW